MAWLSDMLRAFTRPGAPTAGNPERPTAPSDSLIAFLIAWEGCKLVPYLDSAGILTVGVGHVLRADEPQGPISQMQADAYLKADMTYISSRVRSMTGGLVTQNQYDALIALGFNIGSKALEGSTVIRQLNAGNLLDAGDAFKMWNKARDPRTRELVVVPGLVKRRAAERAIFLNSDYSGRP